MGGRAREVQVLVGFVTVVRTQETDLPEVVTQPEGGSLFEVEAFFPDFGLVHGLKFDVPLEVIDAHLFGQTLKDSLAGALDALVPILLGRSVQVTWPSGAAAGSVRAGA
jgi:hypothetical protein